MNEYRVEQIGGVTVLHDFIFPGPWSASSLFGPRAPISTPLGTTSSFHPGIDLPAPALTPILAPVAGTIAITDTNPNDGTGYHTQLLSDDGWLIVVGHLNIAAPRLPKGTRVEAGAFIGFVGTTGLSTGNHAHVELHPARGEPVDRPYSSGFLPYYAGEHDGWIDPAGQQAVDWINGARDTLAPTPPISCETPPLGVRAALAAHGMTWQKTAETAQVCVWTIVKKR